MSLEEVERTGMNESILLTVKKALGIVEEYRYFDADIIMHINGILMILNQLGIGPKEGFSIKDETDSWDDFCDLRYIEAVKPYVCMRVRLLFDPPTTSFVLSSLENQIKEYEWRLNVMVDPSRVNE